MKIGVASSNIQECIELKNKVMEYIHNKNNTHITLVNNGPHKEEDQNILFYMENNAHQLKEKTVDKIINICIKGLSAAKATENAGITNNTIAKQNSVPLNMLKDFNVLTLGTSFDWTNTKQHIDAFLDIK